MESRQLLRATPLAVGVSDGPSSQTLVERAPTISLFAVFFCKTLVFVFEIHIILLNSRQLFFMLK